MPVRGTDPTRARRRADARRALWVLLGCALMRPAGVGLGRHPAPHASRPSVPATATVDLVRDPAWRLTMLPGVGLLRAEQIVRDRERNGALRSLAGLERVPGVGRGTVAGIRNAAGVAVRIDGRPVGCPDALAEP